MNIIDGTLIEKNGSKFIDLGFFSFPVSEAFEFIDKVIEKGYLPLECTTKEFQARYGETMREGEMGLALDGMWEWVGYWPRETLPPVEERSELVGFAKMPGKTGGEVTISGGWSVGINKKTPHPDLAWEFMAALFERDRHVEYLAEEKMISPRKDALEVPEYAEDKFMSYVTEFLEFTTFRDTYPGYSKVSVFNQRALDKIIGGELTPSEAMDYYYDLLVTEFGEDAVTTITQSLSLKSKIG